MKRIHYVGEEFLTGDRIAEAVMDYATALARRTRADRFDIPVMSKGRVGRIEMVVGPASQIMAEPVEQAQEEPVDEELVRELERRTAGLLGPRAVPVPDGAASATDGIDFPDDLVD